MSQSWKKIVPSCLFLIYGIAFSLGVGAAGVYGHLFAPPPPLREQLPTIPPIVEQVVMTALAKDPKQRFATVQAFATALGQAS